MKSTIIYNLTKPKGNSQVAEGSQMKIYMECKSRLFISLLLLLSSTFIQAQSVSISDIKVIEEGYSLQVLTATFSYDGSRGSHTWLQALAETENDERSSGYNPSVIREGISTVRFTVSRPKIEGDEVLSNSIEFSFYNRNEGSYLTVQSDKLLEWKSVEDFFELDINSSISRDSSWSVQNFSFDESIPNAGLILNNLVKKGLDLDNVKIYRSGAIRETLSTGVRFSEEIAFQDFRNIYLSIYDAGVKIDDVGFVNISDNDFVLGRGIISSSINESDQHFIMSEMAQDNLRAAQNMTDVFETVGYIGTDPSQMSTVLLDKAENFNSIGTAIAGQEAMKIVEYILAKEPNNIRAYKEMASAIYRTHSPDLAAPKVNIVIDIALELAPEDPYLLTYKGFLLTELGRVQEGYQYFELSKHLWSEPDSFYYRDRAKNYLLLGDYESAINSYRSLLTKTYTSPKNLRTQYWGLTEYLTLLEPTLGTELEQIYQKLINDFPERGQCVNIKYSFYLLSTGNDFERIEELNNQGKRFDCRGVDQVDNLLNISRWALNSGKKLELMNNMLAFGGISEGVSASSILFSFDEILSKLVENNININEIDSNGLSPLHNAILSENDAAVSSLLINGANIDLLVEGGYTPLMLGVYMQNTFVVLTLLQFGANAEIINDEGNGALDIASQLMNQDIINALGQNMVSI